MPNSGERRAGAVTKADIECLAETQNEDRCKMLGHIENRLDTQDNLMAAQARALTRIELALFAHDTNNEFESRGVVNVMRKLDSHIDMLCKLGRWGIRALTTTLGLISTGFVLYAHMKGWLS